MPTLADGPETRAYYHWHAGQPANIEQGATEISSHIAAYRRNNPSADVVLIGHSMGASMALRVAHLLNPEEGSVYVMTLDPADRSYTPRRPDAVNWWGNAYDQFSFRARLHCRHGRSVEIMQASRRQPSI